MNNLFKSTYSILEMCIKYMSLVPLILLSVLTILYQSNISLNIFETSIIITNSTLLFLLLFYSILILFVIFIIIRYIPENVLYTVFAFSYIVGGHYLITHISMKLRADAGLCYRSAQSFMEGNYINLQFGEYL